MDIAVSERAGGGSHVTISYQFTALSEAGNTFCDAYTEEKFEAVMRLWERSMSHYLATGGRLVPETV